MQTGVRCVTAQGDCEILDRVPDVVAAALRTTHSATVQTAPSIGMMPTDLTVEERIARLESMHMAPRWEHIEVQSRADGRLFVEADGAQGVLREPHDNPEYTIFDWTCPNGIDLPPHWHSQQEILVVTSGKVVITCKGWKSQILPGQHLTIDAYQVHEATAKPGTEFTVIFVPAHGIRKASV